MLTFPFTGRLQDLVPFPLIVAHSLPLHSLVNLFHSFHPHPPTQPTLHNSWKIFTSCFFPLLSVDAQCREKKVFSERFFFVSNSVCSKMNEFVPFLCDQETGIFVCFFGIGCTVPYIIFFLLLFLMCFVFVFLRFWFCCVWICCWRPFFISAMFHTFCIQKCHRWTFVIN